MRLRFMFFFCTDSYRFFKMKILLLIIVTYVCCKTYVKPLGKAPFLLFPKTNAKIQNQYFKVVHPINLLLIETSITNLQAYVERSENKDSETENVLRDKMIMLSEEFSHLRSTKREKRALEFVCTALSWLFGVVDADDLTGRIK